jgi:replicative DNA helicase
MSQETHPTTTTSTRIAEKVLGQRLPANIPAEKAVLSALLLNDELVSQISEILVPEDFYLPAHKIIYKRILEIAGRMKRIDLVTLQDELSKNDELQAVGGSLYLVALQEDIPAVGLLQQHGQLVKEKALLRDLITSATSIITNAYAQDEGQIDAVLDAAEKTIFQIANKRSQHNFMQLNIWLNKTFKHLSVIQSQGKDITGIASGYRRLDQKTSGFQKGDLIVLAARPSMGKTAFSLSIALRAASNGFSVGFFSLEMAAEQLTLRLLSMQSAIAHHNIRAANMGSEEWLRLTNVAGQLSTLKFFIDDTAMVSIMELRTKARKLKAEKGLDFLVVDYLQLLHSAKRHENRHQEVSEISRSLKALAKELDIPVLALSQLSRAVDSRTDKRPMLSDLRESGAIEQDADLIMFLYRDIVYNPDTEHPNLTEVIIGKQRNGPTGTVLLNFLRDYTRFEDYEGDEVQ